MAQEANRNRKPETSEPFFQNRALLKGGDLNPGERHSRDTRDDGTVTLFTLGAPPLYCHAIVAQILVVR